MDIKLFFGILSSIISVVCFVPYIIDILKKKTKPHLYTWLIWTIIQTIGVLTQLKDGAGYGSWGLVVGTFFVFLIFLLSIKNGTKNIQKIDAICLFLAMVTILIYLNIKIPIITIIAVALTDAIGYIPTFRKTFKEPMTETVSLYILVFLSNIFSIFALQNYTFVTMFYLLILLVCNFLLVTMILWRRKSLK